MTDMFVIPHNEDTAATTMALVQAAGSAAPCSAAKPNMNTEQEQSTSSPRRVSFRINEVEFAQELATLVESSIVQDEEEEEDENDCINVALPLHAQEEEEDCPRGLELKTSIERQQRKFTIIKSIVRNQKQCNTDQLGKLAKVCNRWACDVARIQGVWDFQDVQHESNSQPSRSLPPMECYPMPFKKRRSAVTPEQRNKRIKLSNAAD